jgi:4-amino-4-deoxy-L-arabinose transferase-like glycosyltransferase
VIASELRRALPFLLLTAGTAALFLGGLGRLPLFGRDEALYAEAGREMLATGDWVTPRVNGGPFFEKPPLYYWAAAASYRAFGVSPLSARLPSALMAIATVLLTARIGARVWGRRAGLLAGIALATSLQFALIGRLGIMDAPLTCLTVVALLAYERWQRMGGWGALAGFGVTVGLAILLKGAAGLIPWGVAAVDALIRTARRERIGHTPLALVGSAVIAGLASAAVAAPWFLAMTARHGSAFGATFFVHEHLRRVAQAMQGHGGPFWIYLPMIALGFFPWVMFLPAGLLRSPRAEAAACWRVLCLVWIACVLVVFSMVRTKLPGYITPLFPPMALLVGAELDRRLDQPGRGPWVALILGAALLGALVTRLPAAASRLGERVGAAQQAALLFWPVFIWVAGYVIIAVGAWAALRGRPGRGLPVIVAGQAAMLGAVLIGILPLLSPYLGGGTARLALVAQREMPGSRIALYETHPETVNFALQRTVPTFDRHQQEALAAALRAGPTALIAPAKEAAFWKTLPIRRRWQVGDRVLLDIPPQVGQVRDLPSSNPGGAGPRPAPKADKPQEARP